MHKRECELFVLEVLPPALHASWKVGGPHLIIKRSHQEERRFARTPLSLGSLSHNRIGDIITHARY